MFAAALFPPLFLSGGGRWDEVGRWDDTVPYVSFNTSASRRPTSSVGPRG